MDKYSDAVRSSLGGDDAKAPKKEISHIVTKKSHNGDHIHEHHHKHPEHHPMETHTTRGDDEMVAHMMEHMGSPNQGEAEADAGTPDAGAATAGAATPSPMGSGAAPAMAAAGA